MALSRQLAIATREPQRQLAIATESFPALEVAGIIDVDHQLVYASLQPSWMLTNGNYSAGLLSVAADNIGAVVPCISCS
jgi:hypothetical protein